MSAFFKRLVLLALIVSPLGVVAQDITWKEIVREMMDGRGMPALPYLGLDGDTIFDHQLVEMPVEPLPATFFAPPVFDTYEYLDTALASPSLFPARPRVYEPWIVRENERDTYLRAVRQRFMVEYPQYVRYNVALLPEPPKKYVATVDPAESVITITEETISPETLTTGIPVDIPRKNWIHAFDGSVQFSQAYISPNWYQGGNNNINMITSINYGVKLNQAFYPNLLFETTVQYKLAMASAPGDDVHDYTISEDLFLFTSKFGYRAHKRWFYTVNMSLKTQFLNNYKPNSHDITAAFMSPGEFNMGLGMTYDYANAKKTVVFGASVAPLSYNLKTCTRPGMDVTAYGIEVGRKTASEVGSSAELKLSWQLRYNISYTSRLFVFSDYDYVQGDWENTFNFSINRFLSTQLYLHLRYDSSTPPVEDSKWRVWQFKEILSFGFAYKFNS
ncbi:MAG: DUF3078 domain-containing protein [Pseudoflavonifractor sp.]|nr:DUF3078 domain-containing protein [Pseudoflavonifractor sp.]